MPAFLHFCVAFLSFTLENKDTHYAQNWFFVQIFILASLRSMRPFEAIKGHFRPVEANRCHLRSMRPMETIWGHLRPMMATWHLWGHLRLLSSFEVIEVIWNPNCLQSPKSFWTKVIILAQIKQIHFLLLSLWRFTLFLQSRKWNIESNWMQCTFEKFATISTHCSKINILSKNSTWRIWGREGLFRSIEAIWGQLT